MRLKELNLKRRATKSGHLIHLFAVDGNNQRLELRANARDVSVYDIETGQYLGSAEIFHTEQTVLVHWQHK